MSGQLKCKYGDCFIRGNNGKDCSSPAENLCFGGVMQDMISSFEHRDEWFTNSMWPLLSVYKLYPVTLVRFVIQAIGVTP